MKEIKSVLLRHLKKVNNKNAFTIDEEVIQKLIDLSEKFSSDDASDQRKRAFRKVFDELIKD